MSELSDFVDAYSITTGAKQRIPRHWIGDPVLGRDFRKTPSQRELDGELGPRPLGDASGKDIAAFAAAADVDLSGAKTNADKLVAIEAAFGAGEVQGGMVPVEAEPMAADPLAPEVAAHVDHSSVVESTTSTDDTSAGDTESPDQTPAAGNEE